MAQNYRDTDYLYGSARVRAMEGRLLGKEKLDHMIEARSTAEIVAMLPDLGFTLQYAGEDKTGEFLREETLLGALREGYAELDRMDGGRGLCNFLRYPCDCNNIKAAIKCAFRGIEPDGMMFDGIGTLGLDAVKDAFEKKDYHAFPTEMAKAIPEAEESFAKTGNPQKIDLIIDRACYADMLNAARNTGVSYAWELVEARIDLINIMSCVRLVRIKAGAGARSFFEEVFLQGGVLSFAELFEAIEEGETYLAEKLSYTRYSAMASLLESGQTPMNILERRTDEIWLSLAEKSKFTPFGAEVLIGYAVALEYEVKNIRILLAAKDAGLAPDVIRERLRKSYV